MPWVYLIFAGLFEVVWAFALKQSDGFSRLTPTLITIVALMASLGLLALAMRTLPLGTSYMVWTGIGAIGAFAAGVMILGEELTPMRLTAAALIVGGIVLMRASH
ncbi:MAG: DMT family transporter [Hyphomicrobiaceae bacterium]